MRSDKNALQLTGVHEGLATRMATSIIFLLSLRLSVWTLPRAAGPLLRYS